MHNDEGRTTMRLKKMRVATQHVLSMYRSIINKQKMKKGEHALQLYAADMLRLMGEKIDDDDDVISMFQKALLDLGLHNFQNLSENQIDKKHNQSATNQNGKCITRMEDEV